MRGPFRAPLLRSLNSLNAKPELIVHAGNLPATAEGLRDLLAASGRRLNVCAEHSRPRT